MPRFDDKIIEKYGRKIAKSLGVIIKCEEFGKLWNKDSKDCQLCRVDSLAYHSKCREFTKGVGAGYRPRVSEYKKKKKVHIKPKKVKYRNKRLTQPFKRHTKCDIVYRYLKKTEGASSYDIMRHLSEYFECDITYKALANKVCYMRVILARLDHEFIRNCNGVYFIEETVKGKRYRNSKIQVEGEEHNDK
jgi:hypothetical protein